VKPPAAEPWNRPVSPTPTIETIETQNHRNKTIETVETIQLFGARKWRMASAGAGAARYRDRPASLAALAALEKCAYKALAAPAPTFF